MRTAIQGAQQVWLSPAMRDALLLAGVRKDNGEPAVLMPRDCRGETVRALERRGLVEVEWIDGWGRGSRSVARLTRMGDHASAEYC